MSSVDFFQNLTFQKILSGTLSEFQKVLIQIRTDILPGAVGVETVCKDKHNNITEANTMNTDQTAPKG